jgi:hypothetical protein
MNLRASIIATCIGAAFFSAGYVWNYQPDMINPDEIWSMFQPEHRMAKAAVSRLLVEPRSAHFSGLRTVEADATRYVCGVVKAKNKGGRYIDAAFVYTVASDFARVDDGGRMTSQHVPYKSCPTATEVRTAEQQVPIAPGTLAMAETIRKIIPQSSGGTMEQQLGQLAAQTAAVAPRSRHSSAPAATGPARIGQPAERPSGSDVKAGTESDVTWQADRPPASWPVLPPDECPVKSAQQRTAAEALALAEDVQARWAQSRISEAAAKPALSEVISKARCALLAIDPADKEYPQAWAAFVRLRNIEREPAG